ncbi:MAG: hypothetical protein P1V97_11995 [Planctomycetota bacterium]|nr:hypothetical protein [Planctomycetota bacterium]
MSKRALSLSLILIILIGAGLSVFLLEPEKESALFELPASFREKPNKENKTVRIEPDSVKVKPGPSLNNRDIEAAGVEETEGRKANSQVSLSRTNSKAGEPGLTGPSSQDSQKNEKPQKNSEKAALSSVRPMLSEWDKTKGPFNKTGLRGRFVTKDSAPALGLNLLVLRSNGEDKAEMDDWRAISAAHERLQVDENGRFELNGLDPGDAYSILVVGDEDYAPAAFKAPVLEKDKVKDCGAFKVQKSATVTGKVVDFLGKAAPGSIVNIGNRHNALPLARDVWKSSGISAFGNSVKYVLLGGQVTVDDKGHFKITALRAGQYSLVANRKGDRDGIYRRLIVKEGANCKGVEIRLGQIARVKVRVINKLGEPVKGAFVGLRPARLKPRKTYHYDKVIFSLKSQASSSLITDGEGLLSLGSLTENEHRVYVRAEGYELYCGTHALNPDGKTEWTIQLRTGSAFTGTVVNESTGKALENVVVTTRRLNPSALGAFPGPITQKTDSKGHFETMTLAPGRYRVTLRLYDYSQYSTEIQVDQTGVIKDLGKLSLSPNPLVEFLVLHPSGEPFEAALIYITHHSQQRLKKASWVGRTFEQGTCEGSIAPGLVSLKIKAEGYAHFALSKQRIYKKNNSFVIRLRAFNTVRGSVLDDRGGKRPRTKLVFFRKGEQIAFANCVADGQGNYIIRTLAPGEYQVIIDADDYRSDPTSGFSLVVTEQDEVHADIRQVK